jgi:hypothetical protein
LPGNSYEIVTTAPGLKAVQASSSLPNSANVTSFDITFTEGTSNEQAYNFVIDLALLDNPDTHDYYEIILYREFFYVDWNTQDTVFEMWPFPVFTDDPAFTEAADNHIIFDDKLFNGTEVKLKLKGFDHGRFARGFYAHVNTLSEDLFKYKVTTNLQNVSSGDPFAQPVHVYNNISNGFGIFGGYSEKIIEIDP